MRLHKFMAQAGIASRRDCEEYIRAGRVRVNGEVAQIGCTIDPQSDEVTFDGKPVSQIQKRVVLLFYKPRGVICTNEDPQGRKTIMDYFADYPARLYNVGRLDINSEGLLIMTNDGDLAHRMTHPRHQIYKTYYVVCDGVLTPEQANRLSNGVMLEDGMTAPAKIEFIRPTKTGHTSFLLHIREAVSYTHLAMHHHVQPQKTA